MRRIIALLAAILAGGVLSASAQGVPVPGPRAHMLTRGEMEQDLEEMRRVFADGHASLTRYRSAAEIDGLFERSLAQLPRRASELEFLGVVARLASAVRDTHTSARLSEAGLGHVLEHGRFIPLEVLVDGERLFVRRAYAGVDLAPGAEILSINGRDAREIIETIGETLNVEGFAQAPRRRMVQSNFWYRYYQFVDSDDLFRLRVRSGDGAARSLVVAGQSLATMREQRQAWREPSLRLEIGDTSGIATMRIEHFIGDDTPAFLAQSFATLRARGVSDLIIDIRGNGGGYDRYNIELFRNLAARPFVYYRGWTHRAPTFEQMGNVAIDPADYFAELDGVSEAEQERIVEGKSLAELLDFAIDTFVTAGVHAPYEETRFLGSVYLLFDGASASSGAEVPALAHHLGLATLIGEEPNGAYQGTAGGIIPELTLPHSGIRVRFPLIGYANAVMPGVFEGRGVTPQFEVVQRPEDLAAGRDTTMAFTLDLIRSRRGQAPPPRP